MTLVIEKPMPKRPVSDAMKRLAQAEAAFLSAEFLAPVVRGRGVQVRIAGVRCSLHVAPASFNGWGVFRPQSHSAAKLVRSASARERKRYLSLFPAVRLVVCAVMSGRVRGVADNPADPRFELTAPVVANLAEGIDGFDTIVARFDGGQFWFDEVDSRADPAIAAYLRGRLADLADPATVDRPGMGAGQRLAYAVAHARHVAAVEADEAVSATRRLNAALGHAGAALRDFSDLGDSFRVTYTVDGQRHTSIVGKDDLTVRSAGICLSGLDEQFDLNSLVGVLRESGS
jgi:hypothetical protein